MQLMTSSTDQTSCDARFNIHEANNRLAAILTQLEVARDLDDLGAIYTCIDSAVEAGHSLNKNLKNLRNIVIEDRPCGPDSSRG